MKKLLSIFLVTIFALTGCGSDEQEQEAETLDPVAEELSRNHVGPTTEPFSAGPTELPE